MTVRQLIMELLNEIPMDAEVIMVHKKENGNYDYYKDWLTPVQYEDGTVGLLYHTDAEHIIID